MDQENEDVLLMAPIIELTNGVASTVGTNGYTGASRDGDN